MTIRNFEYLLTPECVALAGASNTPGSVGYTLARNLISGGFGGDIFFVNPKYQDVAGKACFASVDQLPRAPSLAVIATPPASVPQLIADFGKLGTRAAVVITAGLGAHKQRMLDAAEPHCMRIMGPNCLGLLLPPLGLNASFAHRNALPGDLAFLSQSGALITGVIDWAVTRGIGFSHVVSLGDMADADFGDMLDYLAGDRKCKAILIYMEALTEAPKFISAARRAARVKPVVIVKSGRHEAGAKAAASHTGALAGSDAAYDAAFRRTGLVRVKSLPELFAAAEMLARRPSLAGDRLTILTNGGGAGVLATDELLDVGGTLATLSDDLKNKLNQVLPPTWSHANPVDIIGDAGPQRYEAALNALLADENTDAVLVIQCPTALVSSLDNAEAIVRANEARGKAQMAKRPVLACWLGDTAAKDSRKLFETHGVPSFETPSDAIIGFSQIVKYARGQRELMRAPDGYGPDGKIDDDVISAKIGEVLSNGRSMLTAIESSVILRATGIPTGTSQVAATPEEAEVVAREILSQHTTCVIKILSPDITHKSDVGGVRLGIESPAAARIAASEMRTRVAANRPDAHLTGFIVEPMIRKPNAHELIVGMTVDETFGPLILFGSGGTAVEVIADRALALPPLDRLLARQLITETRIAKLLAGYRDRPAADMDAIVDCLVRISNLIVRHPEIRELDINPLLADETGVIAVDARIRVVDNSHSPRVPVSIRPYPSEYETEAIIDGIGPIDIRPVLPIDEALYGEFFKKVQPDDVRMRFFTPRVSLSHDYIARLTQIDYAREMAFVAIQRETGALLGVVRLMLDPDLQRGEYGVLVRSDLKGKGLGWALMNHLISYGRREGVQQISGLVLGENTTMINMARTLGFNVSVTPDAPGAVTVTLDLTSH